MRRAQRSALVFLFRKYPEMALFVSCGAHCRNRSLKYMARIGVRICRILEYSSSEARHEPLLTVPCRCLKLRLPAMARLCRLRCGVWSSLAADVCAWQEEGSYVSA